eukprot:g3252.t1
MSTQNQRWANDTSAFGFRMLQKMGWSKGKGLGKNEDGATMHVIVKKKEDSQGLGLDEDIEGTKTLMKSVNVFEDILKELNATHGVTLSKKGKADRKKKNRKKQLATGSKYKNRMKSKSVSSYDKEGLAMILAKRPEDMAAEITSVSSRGRTRSLSFEAAEAMQNAVAAEVLKADRRKKRKKKDGETRKRKKAQKKAPSDNDDESAKTAKKKRKLKDKKKKKKKKKKKTTSK